jgi:hypothetical protein
MTLPAWQTPSGLIGVATIRQPFAISLSASDTLTFSVISGQLPQGLTLSSNGIISGTVTDINTAASSQFVVRATNSQGITDRTFIIETVSSATLQWITPQGFINIDQNDKFYVINKTRVAYNFRAGPGNNTQLSAVASTGTTTLYLSTLTNIDLGIAGIWREIAAPGIIEGTTITSINTNFDLISQGYAIGISNATQYEVTATITVYDQLPTSQRIDYFLNNDQGQLPPGLTLNLDGHLSGLITDQLSVDTRISTGGYDADSYSTYPYDHAVLIGGRPARIIDRYIPKIYQFSIVASTAAESTIREFKILVVDPSNLNPDGSFTGVSDTSTGTAGFIVPPEWLQVTADGSTGTRVIVN